MGFCGIFGNFIWNLVFLFGNGSFSLWCRCFWSENTLNYLRFKFENVDDIFEIEYLKGSFFGNNFRSFKETKIWNYSAKMLYLKLWLIFISFHSHIIHKIFKLNNYIFLHITTNLILNPINVSYLLLFIYKFYFITINKPNKYTEFKNFLKNR